MRRVRENALQPGRGLVQGLWGGKELVQRARKNCRLQSGVKKGEQGKIGIRPEVTRRNLHLILNTWKIVGRF
jgi:hypothetical protein